MRARPDDRLIRSAVFEWLRRLTLRFGDALPWAELKRGVEVDGRNVQVIGPQGIFTPAGLDIPISITTAPLKPGQAPPYEDRIEDDGMLSYRYRGTDPRHRDNVGLRRAYTEAVPLVYFHGISKGIYQAFWPVFIHADDPGSLTFTIAFEDPQVLRADLTPMIVDEARRSYVSRLARQRLHQAAFRYRVITAYASTCAVCQLRHVELLDAAHILPDNHPMGTPVVSNGLSLCKIHHAAYDANILGIRPDSVVEIRSDILDEIDGPMLRHGLQERHGGILVAPRRSVDRPNREFLAERYEVFSSAR